MRLNGRLAVVTGATSGIGLAVADRLAARGARVVLLARDRARVEKFTDSIRLRRGWAEGLRLDVTDPAMVMDTAEEITGRHGIPDILVNAAGSGLWRFLDEERPEGPFESMVPYLGAAAMIRAWLPGMLARRSGVIVNLSSAAAYMPYPGATTYTAARFAQRGLHEALRMDLSGTGIRPLLAVFAKVSSGYWRNNPGSLERIPRALSLIPELTPEQAARALVAGIESKAVLVAAPMRLRAAMLLARLLPGLSRSIMRSTGYRRRTGSRMIAAEADSASGLGKGREGRLERVAAGKNGGGRDANRSAQLGKDLLGRTRFDPEARPEPAVRPDPANRDEEQ